MASERQLRLASLLADGWDGPTAMEMAGWPRETACWLGLRAHAYLAEAGIVVPAPAAAGGAEGAAGPGAAASQANATDPAEPPADALLEEVPAAAVASPAPKTPKRKA